MENAKLKEDYKLPDEDLIDEIGGEYVNMAKSIIKEAINLQNSGVKDEQLFNVIQKHLSDETAKLKDKE